MAATAYKPAVLDQLIKERNQQLCQLWHWQFRLDGDAHTLNVGFLNTDKGSFFSQKEKCIVQLQIRCNCSVKTKVAIVQSGRKVQLFIWKENSSYSVGNEVQLIVQKKVQLSSQKERCNCSV